MQTFYPLVEHRIRRILDELKGETNEPQSETICVLIDEPELHLHPNLQARVLDYFRTLSIRENAQFVIATHSPTIVEYSNSEELYLLRPRDMVGNDQNQLARIATDEEKLQLLRDVFGSTSNLTAMRPIVVVEGKQGDRQSKRAADARIYAFLSDEFSRVTILPAGGKAECRKLAESLGNILRDFSEDLKAYALLDRDLEEEDPQEDHIHLLPVSMIENFLVDPQVIWNATKLVHHKMTLNGVEQVEIAITAILDDLTDNEVARRIKGGVGTRVFRLKDPIESATKQVGEFVKNLCAELTDEKIVRISKNCQTKVSRIKNKNKRREFFHGKQILEKFYHLHVHDTGMSKEIFIYECARCASERSSVKGFVEDLLRSLGLLTIKYAKENLS